jgi:hypothetical protein
MAELAEHLLKVGLAEKARRRKSAPLEALLYLIGLLAENIPGAGYATKKYAADPNYNWRTSPFMFMAFREAVNYLLASLQPPGPIVAPASNPPPGISREKVLSRDELSSQVAKEILHKARFPIFETPEKRGQQVAQSLHSDMRNTYVTDRMVAEGIMTSTKEALATKIATEWYGHEVANAIVEGHYDLSKAIKDLKLQYSLSEQELTALRVDVQLRRQLDYLLKRLE